MNSRGCCRIWTRPGSRPDRRRGAPGRRRRRGTGRIHATSYASTGKVGTSDSARCPHRTAASRSASSCAVQAWRASLRDFLRCGGTGRSPDAGQSAAAPALRQLRSGAGGDSPANRSEPGEDSREDFFERNKHRRQLPRLCRRRPRLRRLRRTLSLSRHRQPSPAGMRLAHDANAGRATAANHSRGASSKLRGTLFLPRLRLRDQASLHVSCKPSPSRPLKDRLHLLRLLRSGWGIYPHDAAQAPTAPQPKEASTPGNSPFAAAGNSPLGASEPGEFTRMLQSPLAPTRASPGAIDVLAIRSRQFSDGQLRSRANSPKCYRPHARQSGAIDTVPTPSIHRHRISTFPPSSAGSIERPSEFTRMLEAPFAAGGAGRASRCTPPPRPQQQPTGDATRAFQAQQASGAAPRQQQGPSEFTRMFKGSTAPAPCARLSEPGPVKKVAARSQSPKKRPITCCGFWSASRWCWPSLLVIYSIVR